MLFSSVFSLVLYALALAIFVATPPAAFADASSVPLWIFVVLTLVGAIGSTLLVIAHRSPPS